MTEIYPSDAQLNDMSGTTDSEQEVLFVPTGQSPYYTSFYKMLTRLLKVSRRSGDLRVFKDGDLSFGVRAGKWMNGDAMVELAQQDEVSLENNTTNYIYLEADGTLRVEPGHSGASDFPVPSATAHLRLAKIVTSAGAYDGRDASDGGDITDYRGTVFGTVAGLAAGNLNLLDWQESLDDELDFTAAEPAAPSAGDRYLNTAAGTSSETSQSVTADYIYQWNGTNWTEIAPTEGARCMVEDRDMLIGYNGSAWVDIGTFALLNEGQTFFGTTDLSGAEAETLSDGSNGDALHVHDTAGITNNAVTADKIAAAVAGNGLTGGGGSALAVNPDNSTMEVSGDAVQMKDGGTTAAKLSSALQDVIAYLAFSGTDDADGTGTMDIQAKDAAGNDLAQRFLVRAWIADAEFSEPDAQTDFSVTTGEQMRELEPDADYEVISDATGLVTMNIDTAGDKTVYVMAEIAGRIYTGSVAITGN